jgi:hypothetical protein
MRFTEEECLEQNRCYEHQVLRADTCPLKHSKGYKRPTLKKKESNNFTKHICSDNTTVRISRGWISYLCTCGLRWGKPYVQ